MPPGSINTLSANKDQIKHLLKLLKIYETYYIPTKENGNELLNL